MTNANRLAQILHATSGGCTVASVVALVESAVSILVPTDDDIIEMIQSGELIALSRKRVESILSELNQRNRSEQEA